MRKFTTAAWALAVTIALAGCADMQSKMPDWMPGSGAVSVSLSGADNTEGCATPGNRTQILIDKADPRFKTMYATLLFAMGSGKKVSAWVSGCQDVWGDGSMRVPYARTLSVER